MDTSGLQAVTGVAMATTTHTTIVSESVLGKVNVVTGEPYLIAELFCRLDNDRNIFSRCGPDYH